MSSAKTVFYIKPSSKGFAEHYLRALLLARKIKKPIEHLRSGAYYIALLEGRDPPAKTASKGKFKFDAEEHQEQEPPTKRPRPNIHGTKKPKAPMDSSGESSSDSPKKSSASSSSSSSSSSDESANVDVALADHHGVVRPRREGNFVWRDVLIRYVYRGDDEDPYAMEIACKHVGHSGWHIGFRWGGVSDM